MTIFQGSYNLTGGVRLNDKYTVGLLAGNMTTYIDAVPGHVYALNTAAFVRRYIHLGKRDIFALYGDAYAGLTTVYNVEGKYLDYNDGRGPQEKISASKGDVVPLLAFEPGLRIRFYKNIHIFLGPTFSTQYQWFGIHAGIGF